MSRPSLSLNSLVSTIGRPRNTAYIWFMFNALLRRLAAPSPAQLTETDADLALAALLVRLARADGDYAAVEIQRIDKVLVARRGMTPAAAQALRAQAEVLEQEAPDTVRFTRALKAATAMEDREDLLTALWSVALADDSRDASEDQLMRLVTNLLGLTDIQSALARQRAASQ